MLKHQTVNLVLRLAFVPCHCADRLVNCTPEGVDRSHLGCKHFVETRGDTAVYLWPMNVPCATLSLFVCAVLGCLLWLLCIPTCVEQEKCFGLAHQCVPIVSGVNSVAPYAR